MSATTAPCFVNPYEGHRSLSRTEQQLLGEYARLAATLRRVTALSARVQASTSHSTTLHELRAVERKMGLVLTLFKASVWSIVMQQTDAEEDAEMDELQAQCGLATLDEEGGEEGDWAA
ncbi:hypothetical protein MSPP1_001279 [Malassezia sp. CBS 17886]|nr:hypothetical protein MSPP1_001279 [Malassezia sp. CBS 17886]